jgi:hypothetical protein
MQRIRTVKPELFKHDGLFDLEEETGLPIRLAFIGLFTCCDREGRFKWRPRSLKINCLPFDEVDFSRVLHALATRGFVVKYATETGVFGHIPAFTAHQVINNRESQSVLPEPTPANALDVTATRDPRVTHADTGEGKGREGKGKEGKEVAHADACTTRKKKSDSDEKMQAVCRETWIAYSDTYFHRYGTEPVRNAKVNSQVKQFCKLLPANESPFVAAFYVKHNNSFYIQKGHDFGLLVTDAAKLRMEWATNSPITATRARQNDRTQNNLSTAEQVKRELGYI